MQTVVIKAYEKPYENPIAVRAGEAVTPDFDKPTDIAGWVWCTAADGRSGWTPRNWLTRSKDAWRVSRDFDAVELTVSPGERLEIAFEESGFVWVTKSNGEAGWIPVENVSTGAGPGD